MRVQVELARLDGGSRCPVCDWPYRDDGGCEPGNCSFRPTERTAEYHGWKQRQTAYHALRRRERELLTDANVGDWLPDLPLPGVGKMARVRDLDTGETHHGGWANSNGIGRTFITADFRRGFVEEVRLPLEAFREVAPALFGSQPVMKVTLSDREPYPPGIGAGWYRRGRRNPSRNVPESAELPEEELFDLLAEFHSKSSRTRWKAYSTRTAALDALSAACVAYGRANAEGMSHECGRCERQPGWAFTAGNRLRRCPDCDGTGKRPGLPPLAPTAKEAAS